MAFSYLFLGIAICVAGVVHGTDAKVLLISMDGFRWDYINEVDTPNFDEFARLGTKAEYVETTFVTKTFPCHYSIATGLYEESHGIVGNSMYDPVRDAKFNKGSRESFWWDGGEPLWVTVQRHGLRSAVYFWPGSESIIRGKRPNIWRAYNESVSFDDRVDTVFQWLTEREYNIDLAMMYFHEPDKTGHVYGPESRELKDKVAEMDALLGSIVGRLTDLDLWDTVNVIVASDHGMVEVDDLTKVTAATRAIDLSQHIDIDDIEQMPATNGPALSILPKEGKEDEMFTQLSDVPHMTVYRKADIPDHWHYKHNDRILPLLVVSEEGWLIEKDLSESKETDVGAHGFDNRLPSMKPIFFARGPGIKKGYVSDPFEVVDIYPLVCKLLDIEGADVNGTLDATEKILVTSGSAMTSSSLWSYAFALAFLGVANSLLKTK